MSERKTIQINPDLFQLSNKTSRKKTPKEPKIQLKTELKTQKQKTLRKNVLKLIREKQQEAYKDLFDKKPKPASVTISQSTDFDKDFDSTLKFFSNLADKVEKEPKDITFKNYEAIQQQSTPIISTPIPILEPVSIQQQSFVGGPPIHIHPTPQYGCLKNGELPTYRTYTRKNLEGGAPPQTNINSFMTPNPETPILTNPFDSPLMMPSNPVPTPFTPRFIEQSQKFDKINQGSTTEKAKQKIRYKKRKKIFKRTYKVGRSKTEPTIGVLVSNKTIRSRISTKAQLLKQTPIHEVRKFLIKKGFIKVGTNAPNDVLRKMYETVSLVCGEIQNHNPENLLYNFIHDNE